MCFSQSRCCSWGWGLLGANKGLWEPRLHTVPEVGPRRTYRHPKREGKQVPGAGTGCACKGLGDPLLLTSG